MEEVSYGATIAPKKKSRDIPPDIYAMKILSNACDTMPEPLS
jgi:hypothetical protein